MNEQDGITIRGREQLTSDERYRLNRANKTGVQVCREVGFGLEGVEQVATCVDFVKGHMNEPEFWERACA